MKIRLPESFIYTNRSKNISAYVKDGILYTSGYISSGGLIDKNMMCSFVAEPGYGCVVTSRAIIDSFSYVGNECAGGSE